MILVGAGSASIRCSTGELAGGNGCSVAHDGLPNHEEPPSTDEALCHNDEAPAPLSHLNEVVNMCVYLCNALHSMWRQARKCATDVQFDEAFEPPMIFFSVLPRV